MGGLREGSFQPSYLLSRSHVDGYADIAVKKGPPPSIAAFSSPVGGVNKPSSPARPSIAFPLDRGVLGGAAVPFVFPFAGDNFGLPAANCFARLSYNRLPVPVRTTKGKIRRTKCVPSRSEFA